MCVSGKQHVKSWTLVSYATFAPGVGRWNYT